MTHKLSSNISLFINFSFVFGLSVQASDIAVPNGGNVQAAINSALPGDTITLAAGAVFAGQFSFPEKTGTGWITVRSSQYARLPALKRVGPSQTSLMPVLQAVGSNTPITFSTRSHHWKLIGIEIRSDVGIYNYDLMRIGDGYQSTVADLPHDIVIDRCYIHGDATAGSKRAIALNGAAITVRDSYIANIFSDVQETQGMLGWNGTGPILIENNHIEAAGLGLMFGGATPSIANLVPAGIVVSHNHFLKPLAWKALNLIVKHHFELKNGRNILFTGNVLENDWHPSVRGTAIMLTVRTEAGGAPWAVVEDVKIIGNIIRNAGSGITVSGFDDSSNAGATRRILIQDNLLIGIDQANSDPNFWGRGAFLFLVHHPVDIWANHNTVLSQGLTLVDLDYEPGSGLRLENNVFQSNTLGIYGAGVGSGTIALNAYQSTWSMKGNVMQGGSAAENPPNNSFPIALTDVGFTNMAGGDYSIAPSSPYYRKATDGKNPGADMNLINRTTSGVVQ